MAKKKKNSNYKHNTEPELQLSFWQTIQLGYYGVPDFKRGLGYIVVGIVIILVMRFYEFNNTTHFISLIGCFLSFMGFDQISKIIAGIRAATMDDYNRVVIEREVENMGLNDKKP